MAEPVTQAQGGGVLWRENLQRLQAEREPVMVPGVRFELGAVGVEAIVFGKDGIRQAPVSPVDGKPMKRAGLAEVEALN